MKKISIILVILIILSAFTPGIIVASPDPAYKTIIIRDAEDLHNLSKNCSYDAFSHGIKVVLNGDIDLKGEDFVPIPIFSGIFDGAGYSIKGLSIEVEGSNHGLFRYLDEGATIKNLKVQGIVTPVGDKSTIGGLVGYNRGTIENCEFSGYIRGRDIVGGLVGWNGKTGIIKDSGAKGAIYGKRKIGGIAGYNMGTIIGCSNEFSVNTTVEEYKPDFGNFDLENFDIAELSKLSPDITDIGGIAGVNTGIIKNSQNLGTIGYTQVGYNVGGIAGRQTGYITDCINEGYVQGRKEVGGIVGQMEPHINVFIPPSKLNRLHDELDTLHSSINKLINLTQSTTIEMNQKLTKIQEDINAGKTHAKQLINMSKDLINEAGITAAEIMDRIKPIIEESNEVPEDLERSISAMKKSLDYIKKVLERLAEYDWEDEELNIKIENLLSLAKDIYDKVNQASSDINQILEKLQEGDTEGILDLLQSVLRNLNSAISLISEAQDVLKEIGETIGDLLASLDGDIDDDLKTALDYIEETLDLLGKVFSRIQNISKKMNDLINYFTDMPQWDLDAIGDAYEKTKEDLFDSLGDMSITLSDLMDTLFVQGEMMIGDMQTINDQFFLIMDLTFSLIDDLMNNDRELDEFYQDVSREEIDKKTEGKVIRSKNMGTIEGDISVGGIAGSMAIELQLDPEDEFNINSNTSLNAVYQTSAIIQQCENSGRITGKKNNVGGIVGSMDLGYIVDCVATELIESIDGDYVGGIAGRSHGPIVSSYAKCTLRGANYIGGIAGHGTEIVDSHTLIKMERSNAYIGAIAGDIDTNSVIKMNTFVSDTLSGIDGISYREKAEPTSYEELILKEGIPAVFKELKLTFLAEDEVIHTQYCNYGDPISEIILPEVPEKEGYHGKWEEFHEDNITFDTTIKAIYTPITRVLESHEKRDSVLPVVLVEGQFTHEDSLTLVLNDEIEPPKLKKGTLADQLTVIIPDDGDLNHTIRYLPSIAGRKMDLYIQSKEGNWYRSKSRLDGKYVVFEAEGNSVTFTVVYNKPSYIGYMVLAAVMFMVIVSFVYMKKRKEHPRNVELDK
jgi:signal transduction histidine kinase